MKKQRSIIRLEIPAYHDREKIVQALANSGYNVYVSEVKGELLDDKFYVCFETTRHKTREER